MRKRIGTKIYDTDKAVLVDTAPDGIQVYRKTGRSSEVFLYNPNGKTGKEMFFDLPEEEAEKYKVPENTSTSVYKSTSMIQFSPADLNRIKKLATDNSLSNRAFVMMLVDEYERNH